MKITTGMWILSITLRFLLVLFLLSGCSNESDDNEYSSKTNSTQQQGKENSVKKSAPHPGLATYQKWCISCHLSGVSGAPKLNDTIAWKNRLEKGRATLLDNTVNGIAPNMPPRGFCRNCTDNDLKDAIDYMLATAIPDIDKK